MAPASVASDREEAEQRQHDDQRQHARQDEHVGRVEAHHAERVDLLAHLHRAELGGDGASGTAGHHDGGQERRELAQRQDADEVDGEDAGAEDS